MVRKLINGLFERLRKSERRPEKAGIKQTVQERQQQRVIVPIEVGNKFDGYREES